MQLGAFLLIEDDDTAAAGLGRILSRWRPTEHAGSLREGRRLLLGGQTWTGLIADIGLPDGSGLDLVELARERWPLLPVLVLTAQNDRQSINRAHALSAEYVVKPPEEQDLVVFARRAITLERVPEPRLGLLVNALALQCGLSPRETEILGATLANVPRKQLLEQLQVTDNTLKSQVRSLLHKTNHESLDALTRTLLREALGGGTATAPVALAVIEDEDAE
jgi:DNA-binding NarL/FixJ family response regulator